MIYYFSGTGNSKWVAETIARLTGDDAISIPELIRDGPTAVFASECSVGIVFPIYAWGVPEIVERFCKILRLGDDVYAYAVCTCGDDAGNAMKRFRRSFPYTSAWSVAMPNNYLPLFDVDAPDYASYKLAEAKPRTKAIAESVLARESVYNVHSGSASRLKTAVCRPAFNVFMRRTKPFYAEENCIGCGLCSDVCPTGVIKLENGKPVWTQKRCEQCMACIQRCPQRCIQYGKSTKNKGRYSFKADE